MDNVDFYKKLIFKYYISQFKKAVENNFNKNDVYFLRIKFIHSLETLCVGRTITEGDPYLKNKSDLFKNRAEMCFLMHDVGRFFEITNELNNIPHGLFCAEMLQKKENYNNPFVLIPIAHHDEAFIDLSNDAIFNTLNKKDQEEVVELLKLLKDVDKVSNLRLFKRKNTVFSRKARRYQFSEEYIEAIRNKHLIDKQYKNSIFDAIAYYIIWYYELYFEGSRKYVKEHKLIQHLLNIFEYYIYEVENIERNYMSPEDIEKKKSQMLNYLEQIKMILREDGAI